MNLRMENPPSLSPPQMPVTLWTGLDYLNARWWLRYPSARSQRRRWHPTPGLLPGKPMDGGAWWAAVHGVARSRTRLNNFTFTFHFHALEKEVATHSSVLAWRIPGTSEPGGLPSMGSHSVGHDWSDLAAAAAAVLWVCHSANYFQATQQVIPDQQETKEILWLRL